jgi:hypothetical protein
MKKKYPAPAENRKPALQSVGQAILFPSYGMSEKKNSNYISGSQEYKQVPPKCIPAAARLEVTMIS